MRRLALSLVISCLSLGYVGPLAAAPNEDPESLIKAGNELRRKGDNVRAAGYIRRAYELAHTPRSAAQLGLVELAIFDYVDAETHLTEALSSDDPWVRATQKTLEENRKRGRSHLLRVEVVGAPRDATVILPEAKIVKLPEDGVLWLGPGTTALRVQSIGHKAGDAQVSGVAGESRTMQVAMPLEQEPAPTPAPVTPPPAAPAVAAAPVVAPAEVSPEHAPPAVTDTPSSGSGLKIAGITTAAVGVVVAVVGVVVLGKGNTKADAVNAEQAHATPYDPANGNWETLQGAGVGLIIGGVAALAAGATMYVLGAKSGRSETTSVSFAVGPGGGIIGLGGRF